MERDCGLDRESQASLEGWFSQYSADPTVEIEARLHNVTAEQFERMKTKLFGNPNWSTKPVEVVSEDMTWEGRVRRTVIRSINGAPPATPQPPEFTKKIPIDQFDGPNMRWAVAEERKLPRYVPDGLPTTYRQKKRVSFVHKNLFAFELTEVRQGRTREDSLHAPVRYEVELEFKGQAQQGAKPYPATYLAQSFAMKVKDLLAFVVPSGSSAAPMPPRPHGPPAGDHSRGEKRPFAAGPGSSTPASGGPASGLKEGQRVVIAKPVTVRLDVLCRDYTQAIMPPEDAQALDWIVAHVPEKDGQAYVMNMPSALPSGTVLPLYSVCGFVPLHALEGLKIPPPARPQHLGRQHHHRR